MLIEIKNRYNDSVLFAHDAEPNSMRITVEHAIKVRANLSSANLRDADLSSANLRYANLSDANLRGADLSDADLRDADLSSADLRYDDLRYANLSSANLSDADLRDADLSGADLRYADLRYDDLRYANLSSANLSGADLRYADLSNANLSYDDLRYANLSSANLSSANLSDAKNSDLVVARTRILPEGSLIGWKKCQGGVIVKLRIPEESKRCHAFGRKCRAQFVDVIEIIGADEATSSHDGVTKYKVGERVACDSWGEDYTVECSGGIHFYITRIEAENH